MKPFKFFSVILLVLTMAVSGHALTITVDGNLLDWGLDTSSFEENDNNWDPGLSGVYVFQEDWVGSGGYVGPGWGDQNYDVEAILVTSDPDFLYLAIATGFPQYGIKDWDAGDISIDVGADGSWDYALVISNYIDGDDSRDEVLGGFYRVSSWEEVGISEHSVSNPYRMIDGTLLGTVDFVYQDDPDHDFARYFIEASIPLSYLGYPGKIVVHWTMECGNDYGNVEATVPEPASILLVGTALLLGGAFLRRRIKS